MITGIDNENQFVICFNRANNFFDLNKNLQKIVLKLNNDIIPSKISAIKYGGTNKADLSIKLDENEYTISVKKGSGNSLHQENMEVFIQFLKTNIENNETVFNAIRFFIWGDKSFDGSGEIYDRMSATEIKKKYPKIIEIIQPYFDRNKDKLIKRFIIDGAKSKKKAQYILYGSVDSCTIISEQKVFQFAKNQNKEPLSIGVLTFQAWNRNINGRIDMEHRRGQIQLKWATIKTDLLSII